MQGMLFEPQDLVHLGVNSLSLIVPLVTVHMAFGKRFFADGADKRNVTWKRIVAFDAAYYAGVTTMVGFWLLLGEEATPLADWATFAASYVPLVLLEPAFTWLALKGARSLDVESLARRCTTVDRLAFA